MYCGAVITRGTKKRGAKKRAVTARGAMTEA